MKKKVSELSLLQALSICEENVCDECPLKITLNGMGKTPCVHCLLRFYSGHKGDFKNLLDSEVKVKEEEK